MEVTFRGLLCTLIGIVVVAPLWTQAQTPVDVSNCLKEMGIAQVHISVPENTTFADSLSETLIQDPIASPQLFVRPAGTSDIQKIVTCARRLDVVFCVRSGGHSWGSASSCPGIVVDLKRMTSLSFDPASNKVTVQAGMTIGESIFQLYSDTGRIFPVGTCPSVGIGGYALGGGIGVLTKDLGLLSDNVVAIKGVTPEGQTFVADRRREPDLFWGLRGGGGGYLGIVTELKIRTTEAANTFDKNVYFAYGWRDAKAAQVAKAYVTDSVANNTQTTFRINFKVDADGIEITAKGICWKTASIANCSKRLERLALWSVSGRTTIVAPTVATREGTLEALKFFGSDPSGGPTIPLGPETSAARFNERYRSNRRLETTSWGSALWDDQIQDATIQYYNQLFALISEERESAKVRTITFKLYPFGGKATKLSVDSSAFPFRSTRAVVLIIYTGGMRGPRTVAKSRIQDLVSSYQAGTYINYMDVDLPNFRQEYWGPSLARMKRVKASVDPNNRLWHPFPLI